MAMIKKLDMECLLRMKRVCVNLRNIISLRSFWLCLLLVLCSACYSEPSTPSAKTIVNRLAFVNQIISILSQNIPNTNSHITIQRVYTTSMHVSVLNTTTGVYTTTGYSKKMNNVTTHSLIKMNNVVITPKHAQIAGYSISSGGFNVNAITSTQMRSQLDAISKGSKENWKNVLMLLGASTPSSQFTSVITTFAKLAPSSALPTAARTYILSVMSDASNRKRNGVSK